jgi:hypothetical protein
MVQSDERFEVAAERHLGMVVFRLKGPNELTEKLLKKINSSGKIHCVPAALKVPTNPFCASPFKRAPIDSFDVLSPKPCPILSDSNGIDVFL